MWHQKYRHIHIHIHTDIHTHTHTYIHTYIQTYTHTYTHTYIHTYILHTYTHTYIHTYTGYLDYARCPSHHISDTRPLKPWYEAVLRATHTTCHNLGVFLSCGFLLLLWNSGVHIWFRGHNVSMVTPPLLCVHACVCLCGFAGAYNLWPC